MGSTFVPSTPLESTSLPLPRGTSLGRYLVLDLLGEGGMGQVYAGYDPELNRKVAVKLLRTRRGRESRAEDAQARLLREAQAMARLSHPNVVTVYDVGAYQDGIFLAMELVEGETLKHWVDHRRPPWRDVLAAFVEAGRGLAAAHAVGIVHRDFKPQNVLVGGDGRVRVTDFGLARAAGLSGDPLPPAGSDDSSSTESDPLMTPLTLVGAVMGTPGYMSPEQIRGREVDARSDQFSYCVSLYEALYGDAPFPGSTLPDLRNAIERADFRSVRRGTRIPGWLRRDLVRGLAANAEDRFPTMQALLDSVTRRRIRARQWIAGGVIAASIALALVGWRLRAERAITRCSSVRKQLAGVWDPATKEAIQRDFEATGGIHARDAWSGTAASLDAWTRDWVAAADAACEAQSRDPESELPRLNRSCLDDRLAEVRSLTHLLAAADGKLVTSAVAAVGSLTPLRDCSDLRQVRAVAATGGTATQGQIETMRADLAEARALYDASHFRQGVEVAKRLVDGARAVGHPSFLAQGLALLGTLEIAAGATQRGIKVLEEADLVTDANGLDWLRARVAIDLVYANYLADTLAKGDEWARRADARLSRIGGDPGLEAELTSRKAALSRDAGRLEEALRLQRLSLELLRKQYGPTHPKVVSALSNLSANYSDLGFNEEAMKTIEEALALQSRVVGAPPSRTLSLTGNLIWAHLCLGDYETALSLSQENVIAAEAEFGTDHFRVGEAADRLGAALAATGDPEGARAQFRKAREIFEKAWGPDNYTVAGEWSADARALRDLGRRKEATAEAERAVVVIEKGTAGKQALADPVRLLGDLALDAGHFAEAETFFRRALEIGEQFYGPENVQLAPALTGIGEAALGRKEYLQAANSLERAMKVRQGRRVPREDDARTRFALARTLRETGTDRERSLRLAKEAREGYAAGAARDQKFINVVDEWLVSHAGKGK